MAIDVQGSHIGFFLYCKEGLHVLNIMHVIIMEDDERRVHLAKAHKADHFHYVEVVMSSDYALQ